LAKCLRPSMELAKMLLEAYRQVLEACDKARGLDEAVFKEVEEVGVKIASATTRMRPRGKLGPSVEAEFEKLLSQQAVRAYTSRH